MLPHSSEIYMKKSNAVNPQCGTSKQTVQLTHVTPIHSLSLTNDKHGPLPIQAFVQQSVCYVACTHCLVAGPHLTFTKTND